jgi:putative polyhydroxyalkanoate system protein
MTQPIKIDLPHGLGAQEAKRRMQDGIHKLKDHIPGGAAVQSSWSGDRMNLNVAAMGQTVDARLDVEESKIHLEVQLPPMLSFLSGPIEKVLRRQGAEMIEDKSKK